MHLRYGHLNIKGLAMLLQKNIFRELPNIDQVDGDKGCIYGEQTRKSFPTGKAWRVSAHHELINADLCGPMQIESLGGSRYFSLFSDDFSWMSWVYLLEFKSQTFECFKKFNPVEN